VQVPWQDYVPVAEVVLIEADPVVNHLDLSAPGMKVARGSLSSDADGDRQATLLIPEGTQARVVLADGSSQAVDTLTLRLTEFTRGDSGPAAMPAELPPTSAYTYAVDFSVGEAIAKVDGKDVLFDRPVPFYLDNFLAMPTGIAVPLACYDPDRDAWIPADDGRVITILAIDGGLAQVDSSGDGLADNGAALGMTDEERGRLATLYAPGKGLWRLALTHLSTHDPNYGVVAGAGAKDPQTPPAVSGDANKEAIPCHVGGSFIECQNQTLGEHIAITGTPYQLHYASDRVPGRNSAYQLRVPLGDDLPATVKAIQVEVSLPGVASTIACPLIPARPTNWTGMAWTPLGDRCRGRKPRPCASVMPTRAIMPYPLISPVASVSAAPSASPAMSRRGAM